MTNYTITVNGKSYDVTVQKKKENLVSAVSTAKDVQEISPAAPVFTSQSAAGGDIAAPMPGKIIEIKVRIGGWVKKGDELIIMEAMKMHNPILAVCDGAVTKLFVKVNDLVQSGQPLITVQ